MLLYRADMDGKEVDPALLRYAENCVADYRVAEGIYGIRKSSSGIQVLIAWEGLPDVDDRTLEPLQQGHEDIPALLSNFLDSPGELELKRDATAFLK